MTDVLNSIINGEITAKQAQGLMDDVVDRFHSGRLCGEIPDALSLDLYEWTAVCHGIDWAVLAQWRENGWHDKCDICGRELLHECGGWMIKNEKQYVCIDCFGRK